MAKKIEPVKLENLLESVMNAEKRSLLKENRVDQDLKKASDSAVATYERWRKYAREGDWDLKTAQYIIGNFQYIIDDIKKLVK